ncbi:MAG: GlmU family protein [Cyclobacteriaceae bacterium]
MNLILFDLPATHTQLLPFTFTRPVSEVRVGILKITEKWEQVLHTKASFLTQDFLSKKYKLTTTSDNLLINGVVCPNAKLVSAVNSLKLDQTLKKGEVIIAARTSHANISILDQSTIVEYDGPATFIDEVWKIFQYNGEEIKNDFKLVTDGRQSEKITDTHTITYNPDAIFIETGAQIKAAVLNAEAGPIYIGKNSNVQEGALIKGPFALCESSHVNMGAKMRGDITVGPHSKVGGEISNSVIFGYSNKGHDGFLGNSVVGEWCNLGADTNTSNLKNNYENVKVWSYAKGGFKDTGLQFCGLMMGDHSKCGINTMFNTGTMVGIGSNIFGDGFPRTFIPSFAWGGAAGFSTFQLNKMIETATKVMERRSVALDETEKELLKFLYDHTAPYRMWEKKSS